MKVIQVGIMSREQFQNRKKDTVIGNDVWIGYDATIDFLLQLQWWDWPIQKIRENVLAILKLNYRVVQPNLSSSLARVCERRWN